MSDPDKIYVKVQKNKKILFLEVLLTETVESLKTTVKSFFPKQELSEIQLYKDDVLLNEPSLLKEQNIHCGDVIGVRFFRVVRGGDPPIWDAIDSVS